jgi:hypothetical protein
MAEVDRVQVTRQLLEAYGVGVRAGVLTPCLQDENEFRKMLRLPTAPAEVVSDWNSSSGVRRPITLAKPSLTDDTKEEASTAAAADESVENVEPETVGENAEKVEQEKPEDEYTLPTRPQRKGADNAKQKTKK